jgi:hypothetical protein
VVRAAAAAVVGVGVALPLLGWASREREVAHVAATNALAQAYTSGFDAGELLYNGVTVDWAGLGELHPEVKAWLCVDGTTINDPVAQERVENAGYWLRHTLDGEYSVAGTLYFDMRSEQDAHRLIYGHHLATTGGAFTQLAGAHTQEGFAALTQARLVTPTRTVTYEPLCAMSVDASYQLIQRFAFTTDDSRATWLTDLCAESSVAQASWRERIEATTAAYPLQEDPTFPATLTLVTCTNASAGGSMRTVVVFHAV